MRRDITRQRLIQLACESPVARSGGEVKSSYGGNSFDRVGENSQYFRITSSAVMLLRLPACPRNYWLWLPPLGRDEDGLIAKALLPPKDWNDVALGDASKLRRRIGFEFHRDLSSKHFLLLDGLLTSGESGGFQRS